MIATSTIVIFTLIGTMVFALRIYYEYKDMEEGERQNEIRDRTVREEDI